MAGDTPSGGGGQSAPGALGPSGQAVPTGRLTEGELRQTFESLQQQISFLKEQLIESQRLATIGTVASVIAHEFNNLLTPVMNYASYALKSAESDKPDMELIRKALSKAAIGSERAGKICGSMLQLARGESSFGTVCVKQLVEETLDVMAREPQKDGLALRVFVPEGAKVMGDSVQLQQVLLNLLINARQALLAQGKGGGITIRVQEDAEAGAVKLAVTDSGPGIPEKVLPKIFEPFFTTKGTAKRGEQKGTGLGLAICRQIIEHHQGTIEVSSSPGSGATFTMTLPRAA